jgi:hypothetical protein
MFTLLGKKGDEGWGEGAVSPDPRTIDIPRLHGVVETIHFSKWLTLACFINL